MLSGRRRRAKQSGTFELPPVVGELFASAQDEAIALRHDSIGTEHVLLALIGRDDETGRTLRGLGLELTAVRDAARRIAGAGPAPEAVFDAEALGAIGIDLQAVRERVEATFRRGRTRARLASAGKLRGRGIRGGAAPQEGTGGCAPGCCAERRATLRCRCRARPRAAARLGRRSHSRRARHLPRAPAHGTRRQSRPGLMRESVPSDWFETQAPIQNRSPPARWHGHPQTRRDSTGLRPAR